MAAPVIQSSFAAGELSPRLHGHVDLQKYRQGVKLARNWYVDYRGGLTTRPGTAFVGFPQNFTAGPSRLLPFTINSAQAYQIVLDASFSARFILQGAWVTETPLSITAGAHANPLTLTIPGHNFTAGNDIFISGVAGLARTNGVSGVNNRVLRVSNVAGNVVTFEALPSLVNVDASTWTAYSSGGTAGRIYTISHPWSAADLPALNFAQSVDEIGIVLTVTNDNYAFYEIRRQGAASWTITQAAIGSKQAPVTNLVAAPINTPSGASPEFDIAYTVTAVDLGSNEESPPIATYATTNNALDPTKGIANLITWTAPTGASQFRIYATSPAPTGSLGSPPYTLGLMGTSNSTQFIDNNFVIDASTTPPTGVNPFQFGPLSTAFVDAPGFGYLAPAFTVYDPTGTGGLVTVQRTVTGEVVNPAVASIGADYSAPVGEITDGITTLGTGLTMAFSGAFTQNSDGTWSPSAGSITITNTVIGYHVPVLTLTATLDYNAFNINDQSGNVTLDSASLEPSTTTVPSGQYGFGIRSVASVSSGKYYVEFKSLAAGGIGFGVCTEYAIFTALQPATNGIVQKFSLNGNTIATAYDAIGLFGGFSSGAGSGNVVTNNTAPGANVQLLINHVYGIAVDASGQLFWVKDITAGGDWNGSGTADPATNVGGISIALSSTQLFFFAAANLGHTNSPIGTANFGGSAFTGSAPSGFTAGWPGPVTTIGSGGTYFCTTTNGTPSAVNTQVPMKLPYTNGLAFTLSIADTLPGAVILQSGAKGHVQLSGSNQPATVAYFDQRAVYAASALDPDSFWMSRVGLYHNFDVSFPEQANDAITGTIVGQEINQIVSLTPMASGLIALSTHGAYQISGGGPGSALSPTDITAQAQAFNGASPLRPLRVNYDIIYNTARGNAVRDLSYNFYVNVYTGQDVSALASHLLDNRNIVDWVYAEAPNYLVHIVRDDGIVLHFTYLKEQDLFGWTHADTLGQYKAVGTCPEGNVDAVYYCVYRYFPGAGASYYTIERVASGYMGANYAANIPSSPEQAWQMDCAAQLLNPAPNAALSGSVQGYGQLGQPVVILGGTGYAAPTVQIVDPTGTGGAVTLGVSGGAITVTGFTPGQNYSNPQFYIVDTTGIGAQIAAPIFNNWLLNLSGVYQWRSGSPTDVGSIVRVAGGVGTIMSVSSVTQAVAAFPIAIRPQGYPQDAMPYGVAPNAPGTAALLLAQAAGTWSLTAPVSAIGGLDHANGSYVSILADGNVLPPQQVVDGCIALPQPASMVLAGFGYTCQMQPLRLDVGEPTIQGRRKAVPALTVRALDERGLRVGPDFATLEDLKERTNETPMGGFIRFDLGGGIIPNVMVNGPQGFYPLEASTDRRKPITSGWTTEGYFCIEQDYPLPATILALIPEIEIGDDPSP